MYGQTDLFNYFDILTVFKRKLLSRRTSEEAKDWYGLSSVLFCFIALIFIMKLLSQQCSLFFVIILTGKKKT